MRNTSKTAVFFAIAIALLVSLPLEMAAQDTLHKKKTKSTPTGLSTSTGAAGTTKSGGKKQSIDIMSFSEGVGQTGTSTGSKSGTAGKASISDFTVNAAKGTAVPLHKGPVPTPPNAP